MDDKSHGLNLKVNNLDNLLPLKCRGLAECLQTNRKV